jgi:enamine deaminase RidA (YjgF/YER057c/UK114 family)
VDRSMNPPAHEIITAPDLLAPAGYAHAVRAAPGRVVYLGGQIAQRKDGSIAGATVVEQFDVAAANVLTALRAAGGEAHDLVSMLILTTDMPAYRASMPALGEVWRSHFGRRYPALTVAAVTALFEPAALVELVGTAVIQ